MEEEEGDGAEEGAADVEGARVGEEELLHFLVLPPWEGLELGLCGLGEAAVSVEGAWGSPVLESLIRLVLEPLVHLSGMYVSV